MTATASQIEDQVADVYDAARAYVHARVELEGAAGQRLFEAQIETDRRWHDLAFWTLGECRYCDPETCPLELTDGGS